MAQEVTTEDYPERYRDTEQNLLPDSTSSATVVRWGRGGDMLSADSLFKTQPYAKHFPRKRFMDHAFIEGNVGLTRSYWRLGFDHRKLDTNPGVRLAFGDWFTPVHGWALGAELGNGPFSYKGLNATYMLNITALAAPAYTQARHWEIYGLAGLDGGYVKDCRSTMKGDFSKEGPHPSVFSRHLLLGMHIGLRGQWNSNGATYLFLQPELRAARPARNLLPEGGSGYYVSGGLQAGLGWRINSGISERAHDPWQKSPWHSHTFVQAAVGVGTPITSGLTRRKGNYFLLMPKYYMSVGKWLAPHSGLRLWGEGGYIKENEGVQKRAFASVGLDYLWNISNTFEGYRADRRFEFIGTAGVLISHIKSGSQRAFPALRAGLQMHYRINRAWSLFLEPQLQLNKKTYLKRVGNQFDPTASVLLGTQITSENYDSRLACENFRADRRHWFIGGAVGLKSPLSQISSNKRRWSPLGRISFGHWFTPLSAWRLSAEGSVAKVGPLNNHAYARAVAGADYLFDATTFARGYEEDRVVDVRLLAGANLGIHYAAHHDQKFHFTSDIHAGAQMAFRVGPRAELYVEPQVGWLMGHINSDTRLHRIHPTFIAGFNYLLEGRSPILRERPEHRHFLTAGLGTGFNSRSCKNDYVHFGGHLTFDSSISYGQWCNAHSGWQVGVSNYLYHYSHAENQNNLTLRADYLLNLLALLRDFAPDDGRIEFNLLAGLNYSFGFTKYQPTRYAFGGEAGFQVGWRITPTYSLYLQPLGHLSNHVLYGGSHKLDGGGSLQLGLRYSW